MISTFAPAWRERLSRLELSIWNERTAFVARTLLAMALALYAALYLQLSSPGSAAVTVVIVANTSRGGVLSKGLWRILGTLTGAAATLAMFAWFAQSPLLFLLVLGLWLCACVFVAGSLRHFRSYGAVLAGYTVAIITAGALNDPANVLQYALSRVAVVSIGVISASFVSHVFQPDTTFESVVAEVRTVLTAIVTGLLRRGASGDDRATPLDYAGTTALLNKLDAGIEFSGMEAPDVHRRAGTLRRSVAALYSAFLSVPVVRGSLRSLDERARAGPEESRLESWIAHVDQALHAAGAWSVSNPQTLTGIAAQMRLVADNGALVLDETAGRDHLADVARIQRELEIVAAAIEHFIDGAQHDDLSDPSQPLHVFADYRDAWRNAVRTALATWLAGLFCYFTAWTQSGACIGTVASICALMAAAPSASAASVEFTKGAILSSIAAYVCGFVLLPHVSGFALFFLAIAPFVAVGCYTMTIPRLNSRSFGFVVLFITQLTIANTMKYNALSFFNGAEAYALSGVIMVLVFRVLLPVDPAREVRRFVDYIRGGAQRYLGKAAAGQPSRDWLGWVVTINQSVHLTLGRLRQSQPHLVPQLVNDSGALVLLTFEVVRMRALLRDAAITGPDALLCESAMAALTDPLGSPQAEKSLQAAIEALLSRRANEPADPSGRMAAASGLESIRLLLPPVERLFALSGRGV